MRSLSTYLDEKRRRLKDAYGADCLKIAREIAAILFDGGRRPAIFSLSKVEERSAGRFYAPLMPKKYGGRVTWTKHFVCCCDGLAYDPLLEQPVPAEAYCEAVFGEALPMETFVSEEAMPAYLGRG